MKAAGTSSRTKKNNLAPEESPSNASQNWRQRNNSRNTQDEANLSRENTPNAGNNEDNNNEEEEDADETLRGDSQRYAGLPFIDITQPSRAPIVRRLIHENNEEDELEEEGGIRPDLIPELRTGAKKQAIERKQEQKAGLKAAVEEIVSEILNKPLEILARRMAGLSAPLRAALGREFRRKDLLSRVTPEQAMFLENMLWREEQAPEVPAAQLIQQFFTETENRLQPARITQKTMIINGQEEQGFAISDPYKDYLESVANGSAAPGNFRIRSKESQPLRVLKATINNVEEIEAIVDSGSEIISMSLDTAERAGVSWNPDIRINVQAANNQINRSLGLAQDVPVKIGNIMLFLQIHVIRTGAYTVLLGRPFDCVTSSEVRNSQDGGMVITITDMNTGRRETIPTLERARLVPTNEKAFFVNVPMI